MSADFARPERGRRLLRGLILLCAGLWFAGAAGAQTLQDIFTNRVTFTTDKGDLVANNSAATIEPGEPLHGGKRGGHSLWISWVAPTNCVVKFKTEGSRFDTLLAAYRFRDPGDTTFDQLQLVSSADDSEGFERESKIEFGATAGHRYEIAVDGYFGATGNLELQWEIEEIDVAPPVILHIPADLAANLGDPVELTVTLTNLGSAELRWFFNGDGLSEFTTNLLIASLQPANVGRYQLRVTVDGQRFEVPPTDVQINTDGAVSALARDKLFDATGSALLPGGEGGGFQPASSGVTRGYNGTQIFNTTYTTPDPDEPQHCGLNGGATYWYAYQPPANGTLMLDTIGSSYDAFLAVYTYDPPFTSYADLIPIACDNDSAGTNGAARLEFAAPRNRQFLVVVDGINGARGIVHLNYRLDTNRPPVAPTLMQVPAPRTVATGTNVCLQPEIMGSSPLRFSWRKGINLLADATNSALQLTNVAPANSGDYFVTVSSHVGSPLNVLLPLRVVLPPQLQAYSEPGAPPQFSFPTVTGQRYFVEQTEALDQPWQLLTNNFLGNGSVMVITNDSGGGTRFYRLRVE